MKRIIFLIIVLAAVGGGYWLGHKKNDAKSADEKPASDKAAADKPAGEKPADDEAGGVHVTREDNGRVTLNINDETQGNMGLKVAYPAAIQLSPEVMGHGKVLDPAPLVALLSELAAARSVYVVSSNELVRQQTLSSQGNASARALQAAESTALHDKLAIQSATDRIALSWGKISSDQKDPSEFLKSLTSLDAALVRVDLSAGETLKSAPVGARLIPLSGNSIQGTYAGKALSVDPQAQGEGFMFLVSTNSGQLVPGAALVGYVQLAGDAASGVVVPRDAVVRTEGDAWIYVVQRNAEDFVRTKIPLDRPVDAGWFVSGIVNPNQYVVVSGAQALLSEELKGQLKPD